MDNVAAEIASTIQTTHINRNPDPAYDLNPSSVASKKSPVRLRSYHRRQSDSSGPAPNEIPVSILEPPPRKQNLPPLPDLRFEQSYLARIANCSSSWSIAWVTFFDHVLMPLSQGLIWHLILFGWRAGNQGVKFNGRGIGARIRRWWWNVNKWPLPGGADAAKAENVKEFYEAQFSNAGGD